MQRTQGGGAGPPGADDQAGGSDLAETVERCLVWLDGLRDRSGLSTALSAGLAALLALGWVLAQWRAVVPVDDLIPGIEKRVAADGVSDIGLGSGDGPVAAGDGGASGHPPAENDGSSPPTGQEPGVPTAGETQGGGDSSGEVGAGAIVVVHVSGAVRFQGLVELPAGSRLADAVAAAGGGTPEADVHRLNLATPVVDGMHIRVPTLDEVNPLHPLIEIAPISGGVGVTGGGPPGDRSPPVNVNQAGIAELERLPGVGPAIAAAIVAWREEHGGFRTVDDLLSVPGIGPAKLAAMEDQVVL